MVELRVALALGVAALLFALGFGASHLRSDAQIKTIKAAHAQEKSAAYATALAAQKQLDTKRDEQAATVARIDITQTALLQKDQDELEKLRSCVARGTCGVRVIGAKCPATTSVPGTATSAGMGDATQPTLNADAQRAYATFRSAILTKERQLEACQQILEARK